MKQESRNKRWAAAAAKADEGISELLQIQQEYRECLDSLPENLETSVVAEKLETVCELDIWDAQDTIREAREIDLPLDFVGD